MNYSPSLASAQMTTEEQLASKLESIRDSIVGFKFATDALENRADKIELELADCRARIAEISNANILTSEQLRSVLKAMEVQTTATRAVQSNVIGAILVAIIISVAGTALSTFYRSTGTVIQQPAVAGRAA